MASSSYLLWSPLVSVAVWSALTAYLVFEGRFRTWTERFFIGVTAGVAAYGLSDFFFFGAQTQDTALITATASLTSITLVGVFLFLYGMSLYRGFRRILLVTLVPTAVFLVSFPVVMFDPFLASSGPGPVYQAVYRIPWFLPWLGFVGFLWLAGLYGVTRSFLEIRKHSRQLARRIGFILGGLVFAVIAGASTNAIEGLTASGVPPLFSTFLAVPGVFLFFTLTPASYRGLNAAFLRRRASEYDVKGAFLTFSDGTLIGSRIAPEEEMIDADSFSATLDVISNFMRTSFPTLRGKWLKSIRHGDYTLVMERGQYAYLTLVIAGLENDQLRREMIERLEDFEVKNGSSLENWRGMAKDAQGIDEMLGDLLALA